MHVKKRRLPNFEACSVALFTSLAIGGTALPARSQMPSSPSSTSSRIAVPPSTSTALPNRQLGRRDISSRVAPTAALEPADSDKDGSISSPYFDESLK